MLGCLDTCERVKRYVKRSEKSPHDLFKPSLLTHLLLCMPSTSLTLDEGFIIHPALHIPSPHPLLYRSNSCCILGHRPNCLSGHECQTDGCFCCPEAAPGEPSENETELIFIDVVLHNAPDAPPYCLCSRLREINAADFTVFFCSNLVQRIKMMYHDPVLTLDLTSFIDPRAPGDQQTTITLAFAWWSDLMVEHAETFLSLYAVDMDAALEVQPPDSWDSFPLFQLLNDHLRLDYNLCNGKFHKHLQDLYAPLVVRYVDLMESSIAQSIHRGFERESWEPVKSLTRNLTPNVSLPIVKLQMPKVPNLPVSVNLPPVQIPLFSTPSWMTAVSDAECVTL
ncbi:calcium-dependent secretion activator 1 isoform X1 [Tachysurus ichikawai]